MPATSDFVKKLYKMLEDHTFSHVVSWGPQGDCFVVKDMNEFTKSILPRMFKHSNFASFVRQLNKYDFHKVKTSDDAQFGEHSWTFRHPDFHADRRDALENIKRKVPAARKSLPSSSNGVVRAEERIRVLERQYGDVLVEMVNFQKGMAQQDGLMQGLIQYFLGEGGKPKDPSDATSQTAAGSSTAASQFVPAQELGLQDPDMVARLSLVQMNEMSRRAASDAAFRTPTSTSASGSGASGSSAGEEMHMQRTSGMHSHLHRGGQHQQQQQQQSSSQASTQDGNATFLLPPDMNWDAPTTMHEGLQVFTVGHLLPRSSVEDQNGNWMFNANPSTGAVPPPAEVVRPTLSNGRSSTAPTTIRVRRSTFVPGWAVPPRVLLVDDDAVSRRLSSKFLQVFGCMIDVAVDGVGAVNKMNLEKYDLVLMDIVMPKMDGVSATNLIRQFDHMTPIISMTSNSKPSEIMTYYSSGMNDILPKPFTKEGLLDMLEVCFIPRWRMYELTRLRRNTLCTLNLHPALGMSGYDDDGRINPLAGMGLSDERYAAILRDIVTQESFSGGALGPGMGGEKRELDDGGDGREGKRGRFEIIE
ncbi:HSF-type DNA-binding-domain-containing protein [Suillus subalutaceus]|uniref:HSF-type DNA-binding-domain-containing protein n=1 Tax=Suillus subalutaceus TaxID=48586 RepID=UPI001B87A1C0|nr:HSF-type DNA-binding-domain-containing protein [Suillus subalutaceus]KAG1849266.1 HSF-type DNA-binding-domain-containing protein [Suillus subalutaceus]